MVAIATYKRDAISTLFLYLLALAPVLSMLGGLLPAVGGIKLSYLYWVLVLGLASLVLIKRGKTALLVLVLLAWMVLHVLFANVVSFKAVVNVITCLFIFMAGLQCIRYDSVSTATRKLVVILGYTALAVPILVALGQVAGILPINLGGISLTNSTLTVTGKAVQRVNGWLYHPLELAIVGYVFFTILAMSQRRKIWAYLILVGMMAFLYLVKIKMVLLLGLIFFGYYFFIVDRSYRKLKVVSSGLFLILGIVVFTLFVPEKQLGFFEIRDNFPYFPDQLLTGRGAIWNIYIKGVDEQFGFKEWLFGYGIGGPSTLFSEALTYDLWYPLRRGRTYHPGPHNTFYSVFLTGGLSMIFLFVGFMLYNVKSLRARFIKKKLRNVNWMYLYLPLLTVGFTGDLLDTTIFWSSVVIGYYIVLNSNVFSQYSFFRHS